MQVHHDPAEIFKAAGAAGHPFYPAPSPSMLQLHQQLQQVNRAAAAGVDGDAAALAGLPPHLQHLVPNPAAAAAFPAKGFTCPFCTKSGYPT